MKASRALLAEVNKTHPTLPFSLRSLTLEPKDVRLGVGEAQKYGCLAAFPVLEERDGAKTAHFRFTVRGVGCGWVKSYAALLWLKDMPLHPHPHPRCCSCPVAPSR